MRSILQTSQCQESVWRVTRATSTSHTQKVNHLLYTCSLVPIEDGILLDTPLVCIHRYHRSTTDDEEVCKRKCTPTPSAREAWKRRPKKTVQNLHYRTVRSIQRAVLVCVQIALPDSPVPQADSPVVQFLDAQKFCFHRIVRSPIPHCPVVHLRAEFGQGPCNFTLSHSLTLPLPWTYIYPSFSSILGLAKNRHKS